MKKTANQNKMTTTKNQRTFFSAKDPNNYERHAFYWRQPGFFEQNEQSI